MTLSSILQQIRRHHQFLTAGFLLAVSICSPLKVMAVSLDPYPVYDSFHDETDISFFREERPNFYWVNSGIPDAFFAPTTNTQNPVTINQPSNQPTSIVYSVNGIEYGVRLSHWMTDQWRVTGTIPFEANALATEPITQVTGGVTTISASVTQTVDHFGDMEIGSTYLLEGKRENGNFIGLDGRYRFATGTNPFTQSYPLLSSGRGASSEAIGVVLGQRLWNLFSFYEGFHYETTQAVQLTSSNTAGLPAGTFQWPDNTEVMGRIEWDVLQKAERKVSLFFQYSGRISGLMTLNGQSLTYGQSYELNSNTGQYFPIGRTNQLFSSTVGGVANIDKEFTAEVDVSYFPTYFLQQVQAFPNTGLLLSISLIFRPF
jgi:hypothetical protein